MTSPFDLENPLPTLEARVAILEAATAPPSVDVIQIIAMGQPAPPITRAQTHGTKFVRDATESEQDFLARVKATSPGVIVMAF